MLLLLLFHFLALLLRSDDDINILAFGICGLLSRCRIRHVSRNSSNRRCRLDESRGWWRSSSLFARPLFLAGRIFERIDRRAGRHLPTGPSTSKAGSFVLGWLCESLQLCFRIMHRHLQHTSLWSRSSVACCWRAAGRGATASRLVWRVIYIRAVVQRVAHVVGPFIRHGNTKWIHATQLCVTRCERRKWPIAKTHQHVRGQSTELSLLRGER